LIFEHPAFSLILQVQWPHDLPAHQNIQFTVQFAHSVISKTSH